MYRVVRSRVKVNGEYSEWWDSEQGVRQGSVLSPLLFSIIINTLIQRLNKEGHGVRLGEERISCLLFADDVVLLFLFSNGSERGSHHSMVVVVVVKSNYKQQ